MILGSSLEFWTKHNPEVVERPTDDDEVRFVSPEPVYNTNTISVAT